MSHPRRPAGGGRGSAVSQGVYAAGFAGRWQEVRDRALADGRPDAEVDAFERDAALLGVLDPVIDPKLLPWSFAYRRGLGAKDAVAALTEARDAGATWVARADIDDCFDRIPQWEVMRRLRAMVDDERVVHLVGALLDRPGSR